MDARRNRLTALGLALVLGHCFITAGLAQEAADRRHPEVLGESGSWGRMWTSAFSAFDESGSVSPRIPAPLREQLLAQSADFRLRFGSAAAHGLADGEIPPRRFCSSAAGGFVGDQPPPEYSSFDLNLLLSEVAVTAEVADVVPGFYYNGAPAALLSLRNVQPLHANAPLPEYALVPLGQLAIHDRVICGSWMRPAYNVAFDVGNRLLLVSGWADRAVAMGASGLAVVRDEGELEWKFGPKGPEELDAVLRYAREFEANQLFAVSRALAGRPAGSEERRQFIQQWELLRRHSCLDARTFGRLGAGLNPAAACPGLDVNR